MDQAELKVKLENFRKRIVESGVWKSIFRPHPSSVRKHGIKMNYTWCAGGLTFFFFLILTVTGVILMFHYRPVSEYAYVDMKYLQFDVPFGMLMRNMHRWSAHLMVIMVMFHMFRVFLTGSYKPPREFNWVIGVILLVLTLLLSFTGYLLPWDQLSVWAVTVGTNMARAMPILGHEGPPTLLRFYVLHCVLLPIIAVVLMIVHFWRVRRDGGISGPL